MAQEQEATRDPTTDRLVQAVVELAKGLKSVGFYPKGHPALEGAISRIAAALEAIPLSEGGLEIAVTKSALLYLDAPLPSTAKSVADLNRDLYLRRASKIIFLPGQKAGEVDAFLRVLSRDPREIDEEGGLEKVLMRGNVSRIWVNRVDYEGLTEMLKREEAGEEPPPEETGLPDEGAADAAEAEPPAGTPSVDDLIARLARETDPHAYRDCVFALCRALYDEPPDRKTEGASRALSVLAAHAERPPRDDREIAAHARMGIRELVSDELVARFIRRLREGSGRLRREAESVLAHFGERAAKPILSALAEEGDLLARKSMVDVVVRIGRPALPAILGNLRDPRWYMVRNMLTILGGLGLPELAAHASEALSHPDLRVKKEAIKALSKLPHPSAAAALATLCFHADDSVALTATAALSAKKETEAISALYRRAVRKRILFPHYRLAHEAIDSLRAIGTDEARIALGYVAQARAVWETERFRAMKTHALRSLSKVPGDRTKESLKSFLQASEKYLREEATRLLRKMEGDHP